MLGETGNTPPAETPIQSIQPSPAPTEWQTLDKEDQLLAEPAQREAEEPLQVSEEIQQISEAFRLDAIDREFIKAVLMTEVLGIVGELRERLLAPSVIPVPQPVPATQTTT